MYTEQLLKNSHIAALFYNKMKFFLILYIFFFQKHQFLNIFSTFVTE